MAAFSSMQVRGDCVAAADQSSKNATNKHCPILCAFNASESSTQVQLSVAIPGLTFQPSYIALLGADLIDVRATRALAASCALSWTQKVEQSTQIQGAVADATNTRECSSRRVHSQAARRRRSSALHRSPLAARSTCSAAPALHCVFNSTSSNSQTKTQP